MSRTGNRIVRNTGFLYVRMFFTLFLSLYTTRLILNALGAIDYGIYGIVGGAIAMLGFLNSSMADTTQRFMSYGQGQNNSNKQQKIFASSLLIHGGIAMLMVVLLEIATYPLFHYLLSIPAERLTAALYIYQFLVISTFFTILSVPFDASIISHEELGYYAVVGVVESAMKLFAALLVVNTLYDKLILYGLLMSSITIIMLAIKFIYCQTKYRECRLQRRDCDKSITKEILGYAKWNLFNTAGTLVGNNGSDIVLNHFFGPAINSAGSIGTQLRGQMMSLSNGLLKALNPVVFKKGGEGDNVLIIKYAVSGGKLSFMLFAIFSLPFIIEAPYILNLWLKNVPEWTVSFSRLIMLTGLGEQASVTMGTALAATGFIKKNSLFSGLAHIIPLVIYVFLYRLGVQPIWTYIITLINFVFVIGGYKVYQCAKYCELNIRQYLNAFIIPLLMCTAISLACGSMMLCMPESLLRILIVIIVVDVVFLYSTYNILLNKEEKIFLKSFYYRIKGIIIV